jgi:hypothetical protein
VRLSVKNGDFSPRWHLLCAASVAAALLLLYFASKKLIFG